MEQLTQQPKQLDDIDAIEDVHTGEVTIKHPGTGAPMSIVITLAGPEHPVRKRAAMDADRRLRAEIKRTGKFTLTGSPEEAEEDEKANLVAFTLGWRGLMQGGQVVEFSRQAAQALYGDPKRRWLRDQVKDSLNQRELFISSSANA